MALQIHFILPPVFDIGPNLTKSLHQLGAQIVSVTDDLKAEMDAKFADLTASGSQATDVILTAVNAVHDQVMGTLADLQGQLATALQNANDPAMANTVRAAMTAGFDNAKADLEAKKQAIIAAVQNVPTAPAPTPTPTPEPPPAPTPTPGPDVPTAPPPDQPAPVAPTPTPPDQGTPIPPAPPA